MNQQLLTTRILLLGFTVTILVAILILSPTLINALSPTSLSPAASPETTRLYDPEQYGMPDILGGYKVLAVFISQDVACMPSGSKKILLQATEPNVQEYLAHPKPVRDILQILQQFPGEEETNWQIEFVGPGVTLEEIVSNIESWNSLFVNKPCKSLGGPAVIATSP